MVFMKRNGPSPNFLPALSSELDPENGIDPRALIRQLVHKKGGRKTHQLCRQVFEAISYALAGACNDDVLRDLGVVAVQPAPDESRLLVTVAPLLPGPYDAAQIMSHLHRALGKLRSEVAAEIHRKRVPELAFCVGNLS